ncbi:MAG: RNA methyltransferase [Bacteroidetes bacterium]|nr:RNA methyltransferase [Bacteroidota bacterium]
MLSKNSIKYINSLKIKKYRQLHNVFIAEGEKIVAELLSGTSQLIAIYATEAWIRENQPGLSGITAEVSVVTEEELEKISDLSTPNKVLALVHLPDQPELQQDDFSEMMLALDGIRDPGNMGTILRTADWFGIRNVACSIDCVDVYNTKVIQSTMGSFTRVNVVYIDLKSLIEIAGPNTPIYGALLNGPSLTDKKFQKAGILMIGNESKGISPELISLITDPIFIPSFTPSVSKSYHAESLNASIANAIICYEISKQLSENKF